MFLNNSAFAGSLPGVLTTSSMDHCQSSRSRNSDSNSFSSARARSSSLRSINSSNLDSAGHMTLFNASLRWVLNCCSPRVIQPRKLANVVSRPEFVCNADMAIGVLSFAKRSELLLNQALVAMDNNNTRVPIIATVRWDLTSVLFRPVSLNLKSKFMVPL